MEVCVTAVVCGVAAGPTVPPDWLPGAAEAAGPPATGEASAMRCLQGMCMKV